MAGEMVLLYNCSGPQWSKLRQILVMQTSAYEGGGAWTSTVSPSLSCWPRETARPPGKRPGLCRAHAGVLRPEHRSLLNQVLEVIRVAQLPPIPLKAVLTTTNQEWNTHQLYEELQKEREAIAAKSSKGRPTPGKRTRKEIEKELQKSR